MCGVWNVGAGMCGANDGDVNAVAAGIGGGNTGTANDGVIDICGAATVGGCMCGTANDIACTGICGGGGGGAIGGACVASASGGLTRRGEGVRGERGRLNWG